MGGIKINKNRSFIFLAVFCLILLTLGSVTAMEDNQEVVSSIDTLSEIPTDIVNEDDSDNQVIAVKDKTNVTVKNSTFDNYFDKNGTLKSNVTADQLIFEGNFKNVSIIINHQVELISKDATLINSTIELVNGANNVIIDGFKFDTACENAIIINANNIQIINNNFIYAPQNKFNTLIHVLEGKNIVVKNNKISVKANRTDSNSTGVIYFEDVSDSKILNNTIIAEIPSTPTTYAPPMWIATYNSYVIQVSGDNNLISENEISVKYSCVKVGYDSLYTIIISGNNNIISKNNIKGIGNSYIYGVECAVKYEYDDDSEMDKPVPSSAEISDNNINLIANRQANGISLTGPFEANILRNNFNITANYLVYGTNDAAYNGRVSASYINNTFILSSNSVYGMEIMGNNETLINNNIIANGNYTLGIAVSNEAGIASILNNNIKVNGKGLGNASGMDSIPSINAGIYIQNIKSATIDGNKITANIPSKPYGTEATGILLSVGNVIIKDNEVNVIANGGNGNYNSLYAIKSSKDDVSIQDNNITVVGLEYAYGISISGDEILIDGNKLNITSPNYYAGAISVNNPFTGNITNNNIEVTAKDVTYGIFSWGEKVNANYIGNTIVSKANSIYAFEVVGGNETLINNKITAKGNYTLGIVSSTNGKVTIKDNEITVEGKGLGNATGGDIIPSINAAIYLTKYVESAIVSGNTIVAEIPAAPWGVTAGGMISEASDILIENNDINVTESNIAKGYDSLYGVKISGDEVIFRNNAIFVKGGVYGYAIDVSGENITINKCNITVNNPNYYGCGININPFIGTIDSNIIDITAKGAVYGTASSNWAGSVKANYTNNVITLNANTAYGLQLLGDDENAVGNKIIANGNYTMGMTIGSANSNIIKNTIESNGIGKTNTSSPDLFGASNQGILIRNNATKVTIMDNTIKTTGNYSVNVLKSKNNISTVKNNYLVANKLAGNASVNNITGTVANNTPESKAFIESENIIKYFKNGTGWVAVLTDSEGNPIAKATLIFNINGVDYKRTTNVNGTATMDINLDPGVYKGTVKFASNNNRYSSATEDVTITVLSVIESEDTELMFRNGTKFTVTILDGQGKPLANASVQLNINGVIYNRTTNVNGSCGLTINLAPGKYVITTMYNGERKANNITVHTVLTENNDLVKYYKNESHYTVKVLDGQGKALANVKVSFNINGVLYERTTNANGTAKMNINLGPGKYIITATYNGCSVSNNITVLSTVESKDIEMTTAKRIPFVVKILDGQGKPLSGAKLSFNIHGVIYERTSAADGTAKLNINLQAGEYIITTIYNGLSQGNTITVKP